MYATIHWLGAGIVLLEPQVEKCPLHVCLLKDVAARDQAGSVVVIPTKLMAECPGRSGFARVTIVTEYRRLSQLETAVRSMFTT